MLLRTGSLHGHCPAVFGMVLLLSLVGCGGGSDTVPEEMETDGSLDFCNTSEISGWAWDLNNKAQVKVDIYLVEKDMDGKDKDRLLATIPANKYRVDLKYKDRKFGFKYTTPKELRDPPADGKPHRIRVKIHESGIHLEPSPMPLTPK